MVGFFNDTMPVVRQVLDRVSVLRLDGDMYESCVDILVNLYDKLSVGGYVIVDDWKGFPCEVAVTVSIFVDFLDCFSGL